MPHQRDEIARAEFAYRSATRGARLLAEHRQKLAQAAEVRRTAGWIYFIRQDAPAGLIKIGFTRRPVVARLRELQTAQPCVLVLLAVCSGTMATERDLHVRFAVLRERGEWFRPGDDLMTYIRLSAEAEGSNALGG